MNEQQKKGPGEAAGDGEAKHGYRNEVSWDDGAGRQPYANRDEVEEGSDAFPEAEGGDAGDASGRNVEDLREVKEKPGRTEREAPRST